ncbi:DUF6520 family protein [Pedobacter insulae]|uniref:Secreted protein n=1 Tax=Pedobacter insulae TaxID=414048 RepID=A0A1I2Y521_9SPHI|nr:DUF6520 family protein [Pedobacter insulae]SFH19451.1 hypothetical protein SAMN04489864_106166 [Pedobacter insulae]
MKNLKKLLPAFALVVGLGLVFTQSAFKAEKTSYTYYRVGGEWVAAIPGYSCNEAETEICSEVFDHPNPTPEENGTDTVLGEYLPD